MPNKTLCFIPARSGSKGIKNKNLKKIGNKSLLEITIRQAKLSKIFENIVVSSDSDKMLRVARKLNTLAIKRSSKNSRDHSSTDSALQEALNKIDLEFNNVVILQVTSPLRKVETIKKFIKHCINKNLKSCCTVTEMDEQVGLKNKYFNPLIQKKTRQRQLRKKFIFENSLIYFIKKNYFLKNKKIFPKKNWNYYISNKYESLDIDNSDDLKIARFIYGKI